MNFPTGFMDVVSLEKTNQHFRMLYDTKGRFVVHQIHKDEAAYKLCRVQRHVFGAGGNPHIVTHDALRSRGRVQALPRPAPRLRRGREPAHRHARRPPISRPRTSSAASSATSSARAGTRTSSRTTA